MGIDALPRDADMLSMMPHLHMTNHVAVLLIVLVVALTSTVTFTVLDGARGRRNGGSASTPTEQDTNQRLQDVEIDFFPVYEYAASAAVTWPEAGCDCEGDCDCDCDCNGFHEGFLVEDGDTNGVWGTTTTQDPGVVEQARRRVFSLKERANYGRSVASFMAAGITDKPTAVRRAMANLPPNQKRSMRNTVSACYDELATIEMQLREKRTNATSVRCRGVQPALFPLAEAALLEDVRKRRKRGDVVTALWLRSQMLFYVKRHYPKSKVPTEFTGDPVQYPGAALFHNFKAGNTWRQRFCMRNNLRYRRRKNCKGTSIKDRVRRANADADAGPCARG